MVARRAHNPKVAGSIPAPATMKHNPKRLRINREILRQLNAAQLQIAAGLQFSNPVVSCDSCTNCTCKPPS